MQANKDIGNDIWNYTYDTYGNIRRREYMVGYATVELLNYTYGNSTWLDELTEVSVTRGGSTTTGYYDYDASGNPTDYFSPGDLTDWDLTWRNGRELSLVESADKTVSYEYDINSLRTSKTVNSTQHSYTYASGKLLREQWTQSGTLNTLDFFYDHAGNPDIVFYTQGNTQQCFYYLTNLQGDVIGILNTSSQLVAEYEYDPYGNRIGFTHATTGSALQQAIGQVNPLRYRGYYYDAETGWYYLQSRYYDPALGRFINSDSYASTGQGFLGYNMFAYCGNNPSNLADYSGSMPANPYEEELGYVQAPKPNRPAPKANEQSPKNVYDSMDDAAHEAGIIVSKFTSKYNIEFAIGISQDENGYYLKNYCIGKHDSVNVDPLIADGAVAVVHSHPNCNGHVPNTFSTTDKSGKPIGDMQVCLVNNIVLYLAAPNGTLQKMFAKPITADGAIAFQVFVDPEVATDLPKDNSVYNCRGKG